MTTEIGLIFCEDDVPLRSRYADVGRHPGKVQLARV